MTNPLPTERRLTIREIRAEVKRLDPALRAWGQDFRAAVMLLSMLVVGTNLTELSAFSRLPRRFVEIRLERLLANGVMLPDGRIAADWFSEESGAWGFWMDVCVANGTLKRCGSTK